MSAQDAQAVIDSLMLVNLDSDPVEMAKIFGHRFNSAWTLLKEKRVEQRVYRPGGKELWLVHGRSYDYQVLPNAAFCMCDDFYQAVMDGRALACKHLIAQKLAHMLSDYSTIDLPDDQYQRDLDDLKAKRHIRYKLTGGE
jgi:predicted nucleic acid-binding Zn finger protein